MAQSPFEWLNGLTREEEAKLAAWADTRTREVLDAKAARNKAEAELANERGTREGLDAEVAQLRTALGDVLKDYEATIRRLAELGEVPQGIDYKNGERWDALAAGRA